jgi:hypothetical protein
MAGRRVTFQLCTGRDISTLLQHPCFADPLLWNLLAKLTDKVSTHSWPADRRTIPANLGAPDPLVATVAQEINAVLLSFDGDFQSIAPRVPHGHRARFRTLSRIWMRCDEPAAAGRLEQALPLIQSEFELAQQRADTRMLMWVGSSYLRTDR